MSDARRRLTGGRGNPSRSSVESLFFRQREDVLNNTVNEPRASSALFVRVVFRHELERDGDGHVLQRIMLRLHEGLYKLIGPAGFEVLLARSLVLARKDHPVLAGISAGPGGTLPGLDAGPRDEAALQAAAVAVVARFIELLVRLVGEDLAVRLVRNIWPGLEEEKE